MIRTIQRHMRYVFSDADKAELATQMSEAHKDTKSKEATKKAITAQLKADVEAAQAEEDMLFQKFNDGFEMREVECTEEHDYKRARITVTRNDTGEQILDRAMTTAELQQDIDFSGDDYEA